MTITVLLGAGASYEAGLPMALGMTPKILATVDAEYRRLLQFVHSGLVMQLAANTAMGRHDELAEVDVESLFNAVDSLGGRSELNLAPFITTWNPLVEQIENQRVRSPFGDIHLGRAIGQIGDARYSADSVARSILDELRKEFSPQKNRTQFKRLARAMVDALEGLLKIPDVSALRYMLPLVEFQNTQSGGLSIATLNYDTVVEEAAQSAGIAVDDGIKDWGKSGIKFQDDAIRLFKLHGSITWVETDSGEVICGRPSGTGSKKMKPALIFGGNNKLRADGPYLELLWEWRQHLSNCDHLIVIGYSFRDSHINALIDGWARKDPHKRVTIIDPGFPRHGHGGRLASLFGRSNERLAPFDRRPGAVLGKSYPDKALYAPVQIIRSGAGDALVDIFDRISSWPPTELHRKDIF